MESIDSIAKGDTSHFERAIRDGFMKYDANWWAQNQAKLEEVKAAVAKNSGNKKKQKEFLKERYKAWGLKDSGEPKDKKKEPARINARLEALLKTAGDLGYPTGDTDWKAKVAAGPEDAVFSEMYQAFAVGEEGDIYENQGGGEGEEEGVPPEAMAFTLESFYRTYNPDGLGKIEKIMASIQTPEDFDNVVQKMCNLPEYADKGAVLEEWNQDVLSKGALRYRFDNFFAMYDPAGKDDVEQLLNKIANAPNGWDVFQDTVAELCQNYGADTQDWQSDFPQALENGPIEVDGEESDGGGGGDAGTGDGDDGDGHHQDEETAEIASAAGTAISTAPVRDLQSRIQTLNDFFSLFQEADMHRSPQLAASSVPITDVLASLYDEYSIPRDDAWGFELFACFDEGALTEDYRQRLSEFFAQNTSTMKRPPSNIPETVSTNVQRIISSKLPDKEFWPTFYAECGVDFSVKWPRSRLNGAPPARSPSEVAPQQYPSKTSGTLSRHASITSLRSQNAPQRPSRRNSVKSNTSDAPVALPTSRMLSRQNSLRSVRSTASASGRKTPSGNTMAVPGVLAFRSLDLTRVSDSESLRKIRSAIKWDLAKNFGHPLEDTVVDVTRGGLLIVEFHFRAGGENAHHVHASANMTLQKRNLQFPSLLQEYKNVTGMSANTDVTYDRTDIRPPLSLREHQDSLKLADQHAKADLRDKLAFFHVKHAPADISNVDALLAQSRLDEVDLFKALYSRYGLGQYDGAYSGEEWRSRQQKSSRSQGALGGTDLHARLTAYFQGLPADNPQSWGAYFRKHPDQIEAKVEEAILTLQTTGVTEAALVKKLDETYRNTAHSSGTAILDEERVRRRLTDFYMMHNPAELYKVELAMQAGLSEDVLFARLHEKYGLPPPVPSSQLQQQANQQQLFSGAVMPSAPSQQGSVHRAASGTAAGLIHEDINRRERSLQDEVANLEARERLLAEREIALERNAEGQARAMQLREDSLAEWERQVLKREETLRSRDTVLQRVEERELLVSAREAAVAERERVQQGPRKERQSRSISPAPIDRTHSGGGSIGNGGDTFAVKLREQEEKLRNLSARLDAQVKQVTEREGLVGAREAAVTDKETMLQSHASAGQIIADHLKALEEREKVVTAKEAAIMQTSFAQKGQDQAREKSLAQREALLEQGTVDVGLRQQQVASREGALSDRALRLDEREAELGRREAEADDRQRRSALDEQSSLTVRQRQVEEHAREVEMREQLAVSRERAAAQREHQLAERELAHQSAQTAEETSYLERERLLTLREDDLKARLEDLELKERESERLLRASAEANEEAEQRLRRAAQAEEEMKIQASQREADLHAVTTRARDLEDEARGMLALAEEKRHEVQRCRTDIERELAGREDRITMQETVLHERTRMLSRREEEADRKGRHVGERESALQKKEAIIGSTIKEVERRTVAPVGEGVYTRIGHMRERSSVTVSPPRMPSAVVGAVTPQPVVRATAPRSSIQEDLDSIRTTLASLTLPLSQGAPVGLASPPPPRYY